MINGNQLKKCAPLVHIYKIYYNILIVRSSELHVVDKNSVGYDRSFTTTILCEDMESVSYTNSCFWVKGRSACLFFCFWYIISNWKTDFLMENWLIKIARLNDIFTKTNELNFKAEKHVCLLLTKIFFKR